MTQFCPGPIVEQIAFSIVTQASRLGNMMDCIKEEEFCFVFLGQVETFIIYLEIDIKCDRTGPTVAGIF